jgi:predicted aspartyl protease
MCPQFNTPKPIHLIVDTGSSNTTLLGDDVTRLSINCTILQPSTVPSLTATGTTIPFLLPNVQLIIEVTYGWFNWKRSFGVFHLANIHCMLPTNPQLMTQQRILHACSLLGMDVLGLFKKWRFTENKLILET